MTGRFRLMARLLAAGVIIAERGVAAQRKRNQTVANGAGTAKFPAPAATIS
jgi:hypothetical protein